MKTHYTYLILDKETKEFYIGVRTCEGDPKEDTYMGSMATWKRQENFNQDRHKKTILSVYATREEANKSEKILIQKFIKDPLNRNYHIPSGTFGNYNRTFTEEHKRKIGEAGIGRKYSEEARRNISKSQIKRYGTNEIINKVENWLEANMESYPKKITSAVIEKELNINRSKIIRHYGKLWKARVHDRNLRLGYQGRKKNVV